MKFMMKLYLHLVADYITRKREIKVKEDEEIIYNDNRSFVERSHSSEIKIL